LLCPPLRWLLKLWQCPELALAIDATAHGEQTVALVISVLYRGSAIPVACQILPANRPGPWIPHILGLLQIIAPQIPQGMQVLVLTAGACGVPDCGDKSVLWVSIP
jgi:hypothetical protein